ncbi:GDP-L-fucose synthase [uncultured Erythrobacter sp.]|uniref:GDP-L-fucose synthase family protein n=1 Tax=uncultured Erythrobacter sp. TaxID=263913 RepID=UPI002602A554|nr:GDP-L-fucose synthase [uncultured Erythrobacter sp.]
MGEYSLEGKRVWVCGHNGMVGRALVRRLADEECTVLTAERSEADLADPAAVKVWMAANQPNAIFLAAAKVGGIFANNAQPAEFLHQNLMIATNVIHGAHVHGVEKLVFLGSSCIYPKFAEQPIREDSLLTGLLEPTNEWYAIAKIAGIKLCQAYRRQYGCDFISAMPTNLYGPGDNYDLETSHVLPALLRKAHEAKLAGESGMEIWGSGTPRREFLHSDDCADGLVFLMKHYCDEAPINLGSGSDIRIDELARLIMETVGLSGELRKDESKPDGTPRKLMDSSRLSALGWKPRIGLREGIASVYSREDFAV